MDREVRVVTFIGKERRYPCSCTWGIVVCKLCKWEESIPVVLLVISENSQVLFEGLVGSFCLTIAFRMVAGSEVELHVECFTE